MGLLGVTFTEKALRRLKTRPPMSVCTTADLPKELEVLPLYLRKGCQLILLLTWTAKLDCINHRTKMICDQMKVFIHLC